MSYKVPVNFPLNFLQTAREFSYKLPVDKCRNQRYIVDNCTQTSPLREQVRAASNRWLTVLQGQALSIDLKAGIVVLRMDKREGVGEQPFEIVQAIIVVAKLLL